MKSKLHVFFSLFLAFLVQFAVAQEVTVSGTVTDQDNIPLPGANVLVKGSKNGSQTDFDGNYSINASTGDILVFSYVGQTTVERKVGASNIINVALQQDAQTLDEVIVVAYGTSTEKDFTGSADVIKAEDFGLRTLTSPIGAVEGSTTGVQVLSTSGQPGSSPSIVIRGVGTLNGDTDPLYIVDGIQFEGGINSLNQDDIASITVLKDAASTSLYGSRAANGVVMITTKKGKKGTGIKVNMSSQYGVVTKGVPEYEAASPGQYYEMMWQAYKNSLGGSDPATEASASIYNRLGYNPFNVPNDQIVGVDGKLNPNAQVIAQGLDWYDALERTGSRQNLSLNASGGGENHNVFFSTSYLDEKGYVVTSDYKRMTNRLSGSFSPAEWLSLGANMNFSSTTQKGPMSRGSSIANPFGFAKGMGSVYPVYVVDPTTGDYILDAEGATQFDYGEGYSDYGIRSRPVNVGRHAIAEALFNSDVTKINNISLRYTADFKILEGLNFKLLYGQDTNDYINKEYENNIVGDGAPAGRYGELRFRRTVENFNQIITYNKDFGRHNFDVTLGHESFNRHYSEMDGSSNTQTAVGIYEFDNFSTISDLSGYSSDKRLEGYFARLNYNFGHKYYISASARRDGSSVFNKDVRWGNFYSIGGSWRIDQEGFMEDVDFVNNLKLRASFGQVGNDDLNDYYISQPRYSLYTNAGDPGIYWSDLGNNALTWETVDSWDVALEYGFFNNRLHGSLEYYRKNSSDLLYNVPLPLSNGLNEGPANIADMYNEGFEIGITGELLRSNDFNWDLTVQASTLKNEITDIPSPFIDGSKRWDVGRSRYDFFIYDYAGVDPDNGNALYYMYEDDVDTGGRVPVLNADGDHETTNDYQDAGKAYANSTPIPDLFGSITNRFRYKNLELSVLLLYSIGGEVLDYGYAAMMHEGEYGESLHPDMMNAWKAPGDITDVPRLENGAPNQLVSGSTRFLTDASYFGVKNVSLAYNFSNDILDPLGLSKLQFYVTGENLLIDSERRGLNPMYNLSGTPEGNDYNPSRVISFGVNVSF